MITKHANPATKHAYLGFGLLGFGGAGLQFLMVPPPVFLVT